MNMVTYIEDYIVNPGSFSDVLGTGCYADVFDSDMPDMVVKRSKKKEIVNENHFADGWLIWAFHSMMCAKERGIAYSIMPRIHGLVLDYNEKQFYAVMEKLEKFRPSTTFRPWITGDLDEHVDGSGYVPSYAKNKFGGWKGAVKHFNGASDRFDLDANDVFLDCHSSNWMFRKTDKTHRIVSTDPFVFQNLTDDLSTKIQAKFLELTEKLDCVKIIGEPHQIEG